MGNSLKTKCLYLPAQSGKTRKVEDIIREKQEYSKLFDETDINIIISANNKLLVEQTRTRMTNDLATDSEPGSNDACIKDCKNMEAGKSFRRIICCYKNVTDPSTMVIICRIMTKKDKKEKNDKFHHFFVVN